MNLDIQSLHSADVSMIPVSEAVTLDQYDTPKGEHFEISNFILPVEFETNPLEIILKCLFEIKKLSGNWDGVGGMRISDQVIKNTILFLIQIPKRLLKNLDEDSITPTPHGTIVIDWYSRDEKSNVSVEMGQLNIGFFLKKNGEFIDYSEGLKFNDYDVPEQIVKAFKSVFS